MVLCKFFWRLRCKYIERMVRVPWNFSEFSILPTKVRRKGNSKMFLNESAPQNGRMPERTHAVYKCTCTRTATCGSSEIARKRNSKTCTCTRICRNESAPQFKIYARGPDVILPEFCRGHLSSGSLVKVSPLGCLFSFGNFIQHICVVFKISLLNDKKFTRWRDASITCTNNINFLNIRSSQFRFFFSGMRF